LIALLIPVRAESDDEGGDLVIVYSTDPS
jgi:hypothetical protein